jgi:hypothetical protein
MIAMLDTLKEENKKKEKKKKREKKPNNNHHYADGHQHQWLAILFFIRVGERGAMLLKEDNTNNLDEK